MKLFICCGANENIPEEYIEDCEELLNEILKDNDLVFGAWDTGIMGLSYDAAKKYNRKIIGMCPKFYADSFNRLECDEEIITDSILDSTMKIVSKSDVIIVLPGGFGTIYELFTAIYSKVCDEHDLPIIIYNSCGYYDKLLEFLEDVYRQSFATNGVRDRYHIANNKNEITKVLSKIKK